MSDEDDWEIEHPWPVILMSVSTPSSHIEVDHDFVTAERVEALDPMGGGEASSPRLRGER